MATSPNTPAPVVKETKPALKTTEFWTTIAFHILMLANLVGIWNYMPNKYSAFVMAAVQGLYSLSRGVAKNGVADTTE